MFRIVCMQQSNLNIHETVIKWIIANDWNIYQWTNVSIQFGSSQYYFMDASVHLYTSTQKFIVLRQFIFLKKCTSLMLIRFQCFSSICKNVVVCLKRIRTMLLKNRTDYYRFIDVNTSKGLHTILSLSHSLEMEIKRGNVAIEQWTKKKIVYRVIISVPLNWILGISFDMLANSDHIGIVYMQKSQRSVC